MCAETVFPMHSDTSPRPPSQRQKHTKKFFFKPPTTTMCNDSHRDRHSVGEFAHQRQQNCNGLGCCCCCCRDVVFAWVLGDHVLGPSTALYCSSNGCCCCCVCRPLRRSSEIVINSVNNSREGNRECRCCLPMVLPDFLCRSRLLAEVFDSHSVSCCYNS